MTPPIRVLIADDHPVLREGLRSLLALQPQITVVGEAANGAETVSMARALGPDVILLDLVMPGTDGLAAIKEIRQQDPDARVLVLTSFVEDEQLFPAIEAGAIGYQLKDTPPRDLIQAILNVAAGRPALHPEVLRKMMNRSQRQQAQAPQVESLTERELQVLKLIAVGNSTQKIVEELHISERTVGTHVSNILHKLNLENRTQAALYALRRGLVRLDED